MQRTEENGIDELLSRAAEARREAKRLISRSRELRELCDASARESSNHSDALVKMRRVADVAAEDVKIATAKQLARKSTRLAR